MSEVATAKQTGGGGFLYEDRVNAYFMACMLTSTSPFNKEYGIIEKIKFQVRADGWLFDDVLLQCRSQGNILMIATSIKSSQQFTRNGIPAELNELIWKQFLKDESSVFNTERDFLCLVERPLSAGLAADLNTLLNQVYQQEAGDVSARQQAKGFNSAEINKLYSSFQCSSTLATKYTVTPEQTDALLKRFIHQQIDFEATNSFFEKATIDLCRKALKNKTSEGATLLYDQLCNIARQQSPDAGYVNIAKLIHLLRGKFELADFPDHEADWKILNAYTETKMDVILESLGNKLSFPRVENIKVLENAFSSAQALILHGFSGSGKTVVAKKLAQSSLESGHRVIWLDSSDFEVHTFQVSLGLSNALPELLSHVTAERAYLIIDGVEKNYSTQQQQQLAILLNTILKQPNSPWKILLTCPSENLSWVLETLHRNNVNTALLSPLQIDELNEENVEQLTNNYPQLVPFFLNAKIRLLFRNLKLLDKVIANINHIAIPESKELGETELIDFIWNEEIIKTTNGLQKAAFIKMLAEKQADAMTLATSNAEFSLPEMAPADDLLKARFIKIHNERFSFTHDLYGDWALYKLILSHSSQLTSFLGSKHLSSPLWTRAFRYYAISLLEKEPEKYKWLETFRLFSGKSAQQVIIQDLMLEALFYSNNALDHLQRFKGFLFENNGEHLQRLLTLFQLRATMANPEVLELAKNAGIKETVALEINRLPIWNYWADMVHFLYLNIDQVIEFDFIGANRIVHIWLRSTPEHFFLRKEASDIAMKAFDKFSSTRIYMKDDLEKPLFEALLLGIAENPEQIKERCLAMCRRIEPKSEEKKEESSKTGYVSIMDRLAMPKRRALKWEDGPYSSVPSIVQDTCLDTHAIYPVIRHNPALATEMLLAVLIDEPKEHYFGSSHHDRYSMHEPPRWYPPFFNRGPFLNYFRINPLEALKFTLKIVDFATERYLEKVRHGGKPFEGITVELAGEKKLYKGDQSVFSWHKDIGSAPHSLVSILMAFEHFLYEKIEKKEPIDEYVDYASKNTNSLAIVGLLLVVAKIQPSLYKKELRHLLSVYEFYPWDLHTGGHDRFSFWGDLPKAWRVEAEKWKKRRHRYFPLKDAILNYWLFDEELQDIYKTITPVWSELLKKMEEAGQTDIFLMQMIPQFELVNWEFTPKGTQVEVAYKEPEAVEKFLNPGRESSLETLDYGNYAFRCEQMIKEKAEITLQEAEGIWNKLQEFLQQLAEINTAPEIDMPGWASPYTNITAAMGTLLHFKKAWIGTHPEYFSSIKEFCVKLIKEALATDTNFDTPGTHHYWNIFMAVIAVHLWTDDQKDTDCRTLAAGVIVQFTGTTVERFLTETARLLPWNAPAFVQVQNLILRFSKTYDEHISDRRVTEDFFLTAKQDLVDEFVNDHTPSSPLIWSNERTAEKMKPKGKRHQPSYIDDDFTRVPGFYTPVLKYLLKTLPGLEQTRDAEERTHILFLHNQAFGQVIYELGEITEDAKAIEHYPDEFNLMVLRRLPELLPLLTEEESAHLLWKPLFSYGYIAARWIDIFCTHYFLSHVEKKERHERMIQIMQEMVEFSYTSPTWKSKHIRQGEDFRLCVVGMQPQLISIWTDDLTAFTQKSDAIYRTWFIKKSINPYAVSALLDFVITRSGEFMFKDAFIIFKAFFGLGQAYAETSAPKGMVYMGTPQQDQKLAIVLVYGWKNKKDIIVSDPAIFQIFKDLVQYLVALKNPAALALQNDLLVEG